MLPRIRKSYYSLGIQFIPEVLPETSFKARHAKGAQLAEPDGILFRLLVPTDIGYVDIDIDERRLHLPGVVGKDGYHDILLP